MPELDYTLVLPCFCVGLVPLVSILFIPLCLVLFQSGLFLVLVFVLIPTLPTESHFLVSLPGGSSCPCSPGFPGSGFIDPSCSGSPGRRFPLVSFGRFAPPRPAPVWGVALFILRRFLFYLISLLSGLIRFLSLSPVERCFHWFLSVFCVYGCFTVEIQRAVMPYNRFLIVGWCVCMG